MELNFKMHTSVWTVYPIKLTFHTGIKVLAATDGNGAVSEILETFAIVAVMQAFLQSATR